MKKISTLIICLLVMVSITVVGCNKQGATSIDTNNNNEKEIRLEDILGREVVLEKPAERVFLGFYFENFMAINGVDSLDKVVAMSKGEWKDFFYSQYMKYAESVPQIEQIKDTGSIYCGNFSMEYLIATRPDVAILAPFQYETLGANVDKLEDAGIAVVVVDYNAQTIEKHVASTMIIGKIMGNEEQAQKLADEYVAAVEDVKQRVAQAQEKPKRVYFELGNKEATIIGNSYGDYMWGSLIGLAGGENIALGKVKTYGPLSPEYILAKDPEVIFFAGLNWSKKDKGCVLMGFDVSDSETQDTLKAHTKRQGWDKLTAIKNNQVYCMDHAGLRSLYDYVYLQYMGKALYPEAFADMDPQTNHKEFYKKYLPVEPEGNFMAKLEDFNG